MTVTIYQLCLLIVLAPLTAAILAGLGGRYLGRSGSHWVCIGGVAFSFAASAWILKQMVDGAPVPEPQHGGFPALREQFF